MGKTYKIFQGLVFISIILLSIFLVANSQKTNDSKSFGLWYVYSESMEPTIMTNDGFILIHSKTYKSGDIITYKPKVLQQPYVTHRVFEGTSDGKFVTKGDNNVMTDQQGEEPLVNQDQIVGKALCVNNKPIIIPKLGIISKKLHKTIPELNIFTLMSISVFIYLIGYIIDLKFNKKNKKTKKAKLRLLDIAPFFDPIFPIICILILMNTLMIGQTIKSWKTEEISYIIVGKKGLPNPVPGEKFDRTMSLKNSTIISYYTILESQDNNISIYPSKLTMSPKKNIEYSISITAPKKVGYYVQKINKKTYPQIMPVKIIYYLYSINEFLPLVVIFSPSILLTIVLYIIWLKKWEMDRKVIMDWLIPLRKILRKL